MVACWRLWLRRGGTAVLALTALAAVTGCGSREEAAQPDAITAEQTTMAPTEAPTPLPAGMAPLLETFTGDLDGMVERRIIRKALLQTEGSKTKAAELLHVSFDSLRYRMEKLGIA